MKKCAACKVEKNDSEFYIRGNGKLHCYCKECTREKSIAVRNRRIEKAREYNRKWRLENRDKALQSAASWRDRNREVLRLYYKQRRLKAIQKNPNWDTEQSRKRLYGVSQGQYDAMLIAQNYVCAICNKKCISGRNLSVDHNHKTGKVRALLCCNCNRGIGHFQEDITIMQKAIEYLSKY